MSDGAVNVRERFPEGIEVIAFDADDTLWDCQSHFEEVERRYCRMLSRYGDTAAVSAALFRTEAANMPLLGYGTKAFTLSLIENAVAVSGGSVGGSVIGSIVDMGKSLLEMPATPLPGVRETLERLAAETAFRLVLFTKGELLDQENKLRRSGLAGFFSHVEVVSDKTVDTYAVLCARLGVSPDRLLMVGNSFRSDIAPAVAAGAYAVHIPFHVVWELEKAEEFSHERIMRLPSFAALCGMIG